jgi:hypothetical protein
MLANVAIMNNTPAIVAAVGIIGCHFNLHGNVSLYCCKIRSPGIHRYDFRFIKITHISIFCHPYSTGVYHCPRLQRSTTASSTLRFRVRQSNEGTGPHHHATGHGRND